MYVFKLFCLNESKLVMFRSPKVKVHLLQSEEKDISNIFRISLAKLYLEITGKNIRLFC